MALAEKAARKTCNQTERAQAAIPAVGFDGLPPHDIKAEQALLADMILAGEYPDFQRELIHSVAASDFFQPDHVIIHKALTALAGRSDLLAIDVVTLCSYLKDRGQLRSIGGTTPCTLR